MRSLYAGLGNRGFTLVLSILISSILLAMGFSLYTLSVKELRLERYLKDSERAYSAADRGMECALYWDRAYPYNGLSWSTFPTSTMAIWRAPSGAPWPAGITCDRGNGVQVRLTNAGAPFWTVTPIAGPPAGARMSFSITYTNGTCATVTVEKILDDTNITSDGYSDCNVNSPRRTQRTLYSYTNY